MTEENEKAIAPIARKKRVKVDAEKPAESVSAPEKAPQMRNAPTKVATVEIKPAPKPTPQKADPIFVETSIEQASFEDFEALMNSHENAMPQAENFSVGDKVQATVDKIGEKSIYLIVGSREGIADREEYTDKLGELTLSLGETKGFFVTAIRDQQLYLGERLNTKEAAMDAVAVSFESGIPIEGRITGLNKGGFEVEIRGVRAFCPISQIQLSFCEEPNEHLGQSYIFRVIEFAEGGKKVVLSRAAILKEAAQERTAELMQTLTEGAVLTGVVTRLADFGAFIDIGGVEGLAHVSELGWSRVSHPSEVVSVGQSVQVTVKSIEEGGEKGPRISLSMKDAGDDPWEKMLQTHSEGDTLTGRVTRIEVYGAFVELIPGVEGLVHISELSWDERVRNSGDIVQLGQHIAVKILNIDPVEHRIGLSVKAAQNDPWADILANFQLGMEVQGTVERIQDFGVFVSVGPGVTALLPRSEMNIDQNDSPFRVFKEGAELTAKVISIDPNSRRMALSMKKNEAVEETGPSTYVDAGTSGMGTMADLFKNRK